MAQTAPVVATPTAIHVFKLAWPMTLKAVILHGTVVIDAYLVSALGETSLAAMGLAAAIAGIVLGAIFAFSSALQIRAAQATGTQNLVFLKSVIVSGLTVSLTIGLVGVVFIWTAGQSLISYLAPNSTVATLSWSYLAIFSLVILGETIGQSLSSFFNGCGRTKIPLASFCLSLPVNVVSSIVLIHGYLGFPALGVAGAALGSALAIGVQVVFLGVLFLRGSGHLLRISGWRQERFVPTLRRHIAFAWPIGATFFSATLAAHVCSMIYAQMSLYAFAAMTLIIPWNMVAGQISMQWAQATGITVAQLLGKQASEAELDRFLSSAWRGAFVAAGCVALVFLALSVSVDTLYENLSDQTRATVLTFIPVLLLLQFPRATNAICGNTLRASGDTVYVMHIFIWPQWLFRVPATAACVLHLEAAAVWILSLLLIEELLKFPAFHRRLFLGNWKRVVLSE